MRNVILAAVLVVSLLIGGMGGTFATWSDSETSLDNYIATGSVDLKVNDRDDAPWGEGVEAIIQVDDVIPCKVYGPYVVTLWNASQDGMPPAQAFLDIKNAECSNVDPKPGSGYICPTTGDLKPEPELVAEFGGKVNCQDVPGVGILGDNCSMGSHTRLWVSDNPALVPDKDAPYPDPAFLIDDKIGNIVGEQELGELEACVPKEFYLWFHLQQPSEEEHGYNFFPNPGEPGHDDMEWLKFNDWPSWALMKDKITFDLQFDLYLIDP
jgi:hypothetical protein